MTRRIPIVCTRLGGLPEIVEDGRSGLLYESRNAQDLAEKIRRLWTEPTLALELADRAWDKVKQEYHPGVVLGKLEALYDRAASTRPRQSA
jgi:glycosyltransferase involved in cell wall biosynthesis